MSTDDRLTMALYAAEQDDKKRRALFDQDMQFIFAKARDCENHHLYQEDALKFCSRCLDDLHKTILARDAVNFRPFMLFETDICALLRVLFRQPISTEGQSGPQVHDLLKRLQRHIGTAQYAEFVDGRWPERLK